MIKKDDKVVLYIIVILLIIFLPLSAYGTYLKFFTSDMIENPNENFKHEGSLYFYENDDLLGTYKCINTSCDYAKSVEDEIFMTYEYENVMENIDILNSKYALIEDSTYVLQDMVNDIPLTTFESVKFYNSNIEGNNIFVKNNGKYGMLSLESIKLIIPYEYDYLGVKNYYNNGLLQISNILAKKDNGFFILNDKNEVISSIFNENVIDYNSNYIVTTNNIVYDYEGNKNFELVLIKQVFLLNDYIIIMDDNDNIFVYDNNFNELKSFNSSGGSLSAIEHLETIEIFIDNISIDNVEK